MEMLEEEIMLACLSGLSLEEVVVADCGVLRLGGLPGIHRDNWTEYGERILQNLIPFI